MTIIESTVPSAERSDRAVQTSVHAGVQSNDRAKSKALLDAMEDSLPWLIALNDTQPEFEKVFVSLSRFVLENAGERDIEYIHARLDSLLATSARYAVE
jgi:hypothetical protein